MPHSGNQSAVTRAASGIVTGTKVAPAPSITFNAAAIAARVGASTPALFQCTSTPTRSPRRPFGISPR